MTAEIEALIKDQGKAFDAFKATMTEIETETKKLGAADGILTDRTVKIELALDKAAEGLAALDAARKAETKAREELELKIGRFGLAGHSDESAKREIDIKSFNDTLAGLNASRNRVFQRLDAKGYDDYKAAMLHYLREGKDNLSTEEQKALAVGSDPDGGYWVMPDLGGRMVTKIFETSPVRQNADVQTISTDALEGIEDLGEGGAGYAGERTQGSDTSTAQIGKWRIPVHWIDTEPKATQQLLDDAMVDVEAWLAGKVSDKLGRFENSEFVTGALNRILGFMLGYTQTADSGSGVTWGQIGYKATGASGAFPSSNPLDVLIDLVGLLKNAYLANAKWYTRRSVITLIRKFKDGDGNYIWQPSLVAGTPEMIMGYPIVRMEDISAVAANSYSLAFGDLKQAYQIVDRQGIRVLRDPYTAKPYIKFYTTKRTGGGMVNFEALKLLKFGVS